MQITSREKRIGFLGKRSNYWARVKLWGKAHLRRMLDDYSLATENLLDKLASPAKDITAEVDALQKIYLEAKEWRR